MSEIIACTLEEALAQPRKLTVIVTREMLERLEKQLAERDAALARCAAVLTSVSFLGHPVAIEAGKILDALPVSAQATAKVLAAARRLIERGFCYETFSDLEKAISEERAQT